MNASRQCFALLGILTAAAACSSTINHDDGDDGFGGDGDTSGSTTGVSKSVSNADGVGPSSASSGLPTEEPPQGLFDCSLELTCSSVSFHIYPDPPEGWKCIAELALSGEPGIVRGAWTPGPYFTIDETLVIYRGDGKAIVQGRNKSCGMPGGTMCPEGGLPWGEPGDVQLCDVQVDAEVATACAAADMQGCGAMPSGTVTHCVPIAEPTCAEAAAFGAAQK